jgi:uncharacterized protein (TIGR03435 family)
VSAITFASATFVRAQSSDTAADWEKAAGGKMSFEVASVKRAVPGHGYHTSFPLTLGSSFGAVGNLMSVDVPLRMLLGFAFKLSVGQMHYLLLGLPDWVDSEWVDVEGRAPIANPSKDQFRLMMQAVLVDRLKMAIREEKRPMTIYALALKKLGATGPQLRPHVNDASCGPEARADAPAPPASDQFSAFPCDSTYIAPANYVGRAGVSGRVRGGGRDVNLDYIAAFLTGTGMQNTAPDRPVINETGLTGNYDFWVEFVPEGEVDGEQPDANGPSLAEALQDQLGLKLVAKTGPVVVLVVDHIEEPTPN